MTEAVDHLLTVRDLRTHFFLDEGTARAVDGVDLEIPRRKTVGLVGESGCGKSVTALSVLRLVRAPGRIVSGRIVFHGAKPEGQGPSGDGSEPTGAADVVLTELDEAGEAIRRIRGNEIAMIFQEPMTSLNPVYTIGNQIAEAVALHRGVARKQAWAQAVEMLARVGIPGPHQRSREYPHQLSGGMRQRAMIAMALSCHPALLIADEPTTALDVTIQAQVLDLMRRLQEEMGMSILMITHDLGVIAEVSDEVAVMYAGRVVERGDADAIFYEPLHPYTRGLLASIPVLGKRSGGGSREPLSSIPGTVPHALALPEGCAFRPRCPEAGPECVEVPELKEAKPGHAVRCCRAH